MAAIQPLPPVNAPFVPPTFGGSDPWRLSQGLKGIERGAAARGTLLTGGTLKALTDYGINSANQDYGNDYQRALQTYTTNRDTSALNYVQQRTGYQDSLASAPPSYLPPSYGMPPQSDGQQLQRDRLQSDQRQSQIDQGTAQADRNRAQMEQDHALAQQALANANAMPRSWSEPAPNHGFVLSQPAPPPSADPSQMFDQNLQRQEQARLDAERRRQAQLEQEAFQRAGSERQNAATNAVAPANLPPYLPYGPVRRRPGVSLGA